MINNVTVTNHLGESIVLSMRSPEQSGFLIQEIDGLGPTKANINISEMAGINGSIFNSSKIRSRNIVLSLIFLKSPDIETTRQKSYKYFPLSRQIKLEINTDNRTCYIYGYVESNEVTIFKKQVGTKISIICPDPFLYDVNQQTTVFSSITNLFEFPFSNESLVSNLIEFGSITLETEKTVLYSGDASVGILIHVHAIGTATNIEIIDSESLNSIYIDSTKLVALLGEGIHEGDDIFISTKVGNKYAILVRDGIEYNILNVLDSNPHWFKLEKGDNIIAYTADTGLSNLQFEIINDVAYEGI